MFKPRREGLNLQISTPNWRSVHQVLQTEARRLYFTLEFKAHQQVIEENPPKFLSEGITKHVFYLEKIRTTDTCFCRSNPPQIKSHIKRKETKQTTPTKQQ